MDEFTVDDLYAVDFGTYIELIDGRRAMRIPFGFTLHYKDVTNALDWITKSVSAEELLEIGVERIVDE